MYFNDIFNQRWVLSWKYLEMDRKEHRAIVAARKDRSDHFDSSDGGGLTGKIDVRSSFVLSENSMKR